MLMINTDFPGMVFNSFFLIISGEFIKEYSIPDVVNHKGFLILFSRSY